MQQDYTRCYTTLDLIPGSEWNDVRTTYRTLVKRWHPDRFPNDVAQRQQAEEKIKAITEAYRALEEYYRAHGTTPGPPARPPVYEAPVAKWPHTAPQQEPLDREPIFAPADIIAASPHGHRTLMWILLMGAVLLLIYLLSDDEGDTVTVPATEESRMMSDVVAVNAATDEADKGPRFTVGSTIGDVYSIQGIPTKIDDETWHYGKSAVYFVKGKVSRWANHPANPLKVDLDASGLALRVSMFGYGSTKAEVRSIQGEPSRETDNLWEYGASRIFFKGDRVSSWHESPLSPLKAAK